MKLVDRETLTAQQMGLRDWYLAEYEDDELGAELNPCASFYDLYFAVDRGIDVYSVMGVGDSIIRERLFGELAKLMHVTYAEVYDAWLAH